VALGLGLRGKGLELGVVVGSGLEVEFWPNV
jgi:hypothetical protein